MVVKTVSLSKIAIENMVLAIVESHPFEETGLLFGIVKKETLQVNNAYPLITSLREKFSVGYGNIRAINRLRKMNELLGERGRGLKIGGGFHSQIFKEYKGYKVDKDRLSVHDLDFISDEMKLLKLDYWIEIVLGVKAKYYKTPKKPNLKFKKSGKRIYCYVRLAERYGFYISFNAYLIDMSRKSKQITLRTSK